VPLLDKRNPAHHDSSSIVLALAGPAENLSCEFWPTTKKETDPTWPPNGEDFAYVRRTWPRGLVPPSTSAQSRYGYVPVDGLFRKAFNGGADPHGLVDYLAERAGPDIPWFRQAVAALAAEGVTHGS
jgi:hypothetical protein